MGFKVDEMMSIQVNNCLLLVGKKVSGGYLHCDKAIVWYHF